MALFDSIEVIATSNEEAARFLEGAKELGENVRQTTVYEGPVPNGSYVEINENVRMATPEFMFLRKANELPKDEAIMLCCELLSCYATQRTAGSMKRGEIVRNDQPHTNIFYLTLYLSQVAGTKEGDKAMDVFREALEYADAYEAMCEVWYETGRPQFND